jgi:phage repressor protein C with HTH and peptisase S24 domain
MCHLLTGTTQNRQSFVDATEVASQIHPVIRPLSDNLQDLPPQEVADDYFAVPLVDGQVAAGPGSVVWEKVRSLVWVYKPELGRRKNLVAIRVAGDSMTPTIPDQAIIIVDKDSRLPNGCRKGIWALRTEDGDVQIKRLHRHVPPRDSKERETWWVFSDNFQDYPPSVVWTGDFERLIIGQVVWMWRSLV